MNIQLFNFFLFFFISVTSFGQAVKDKSVIEKEKSTRIKVVLKGKITDSKTGELLPGASIYLTDDKIGAQADQDGKYILNNIPPGHHIIEVSHSGYSTIVEHIELNSNTEKDFVLSTVIIENQEVIVTGVSGATSIRKSPVPVTSVRKLTLLRNPSSNLIDALSHIPGVSQVSTGPSISKPTIRGLGYNRVIIINDGLRQEGQQWGDEHGIEIDELSIAKAEVLKGPASMMYGSDAMAGVVNIITNVPVSEGVFKANVLSNYQSSNNLHALNGSLAGNKNGLNWNVYGTLKSAGDYKNKYDGKVLNSRFNEKNIGGYIGVNKSWGYSHLIFSRFDQQLGLIEGERDNVSGRFILFSGTPLERIATASDLDSRKVFLPRQRVQHNKIISDNNFAFKKNRLKLNFGYQNNLRQEFGNPENPEEKSLFFDLKTINYNIQWQLPEIKEWHITFGLNGMDQSNRNKGEEVLIPEYNLFDFGSFIFFQRFFKKSTWSGGMRFDNRSLHSKEFSDAGGVKFNAFKKSFSTISGSLGVSVEPGENVTLKGNIARGFRGPTLAELSSNGAHEGSNRYEYGDQNLKSETSLQLDAGLDIYTEHFNIGVSFFYNRINDFIFYKKLLSVSGGDSLVNSGGTDIPAFKFTQNDANLYGLEMMFDLHPHPLDWLHFENTFSFVRGKFDKKLDGNKTGSDNLSLIPAPKWTSEIRGDFMKLGKNVKSFYAKIETEIYFRQNKPFTGFNTETATSGYTLINAGIGGDVVKNKKTLFSLYFGVANITDKVYQNHLSRLKYTAENLATGRTGVFNVGRNFSIKLNIPIQISK